MSEPNRLAAGAAHQFGGIDLDRSRPVTFRLDGRRLSAFAGDTVLSALFANGVVGFGVVDDSPIGLGDRFAPLVALKGGDPVPMDRVLVADGLDLKTVAPVRARPRHGTLGLHLQAVSDPPWLRSAPAETLVTDLLVVGGGVAGLAAAEAASAAGRSVILVERRPWLGGDARYFGPVGDEESPEAATGRLAAALRASDRVRILAAAEAFSLTETTALVHHVVEARGRVIEVKANHILLATGSMQRLALFAGNRLPGVVGSMFAYHLAKRFGVAPGRSAIVATQANHGYRLALRLKDAGLPVARVVDPRINAQSRFVDFAKASGLTLTGGAQPFAVRQTRHGGLHATFTGAGLKPLELEAESLVVAGPFQPDLALWMAAGGRSVWDDGRLVAQGTLEGIALAGAAAGQRSMPACIAGGRAAVAVLFGGAPEAIVDTEPGEPFETRDAPNMQAAAHEGPPAYLDAGPSLLRRPAPAAPASAAIPAHAPSLADVAAMVELGLTSPLDAAAIAEERGAPGPDLAASDWRPVPRETGHDWLRAWLGDDAVRLHLAVDGKRVFERGALVYLNTDPPDPARAAGVIVESAAPGGIALMSADRLARGDRFVVETLDGPSPARVRP